MMMFAPALEKEIQTEEPLPSVPVQVTIVERPGIDLVFELPGPPFGAAQKADREYALRLALRYIG
jgi:hypothetical protein